MDGIECLWMGGGTSKGAYFLASDQPSDVAERDALLLRIMGSPDPVQIDGIGGADPLTSKVAVLAPPSRPDADVDYLFLQVFVDRPQVSAAQAAATSSPGSALRRSSAGWWRPRATRPRCASTCATPARSPPPAFSPPADLSTIPIAPLVPAPLTGGGWLIYPSPSSRDRVSRSFCAPLEECR